MKILCAWCFCEVGEHKGVKTEEISHGICFQCMFRQSPLIAIQFYIERHPEDVPALTLAVLAGVFLWAWLLAGSPS